MKNVLRWIIALKKWNWQLFFSVCAFLASIFTVFIIVYGNLRSDITPYVSEGLVLIFVGILATFVVVSNYVQVKDAKDEFERQISNLDEKFKKSTSAAIERMDKITIAQFEVIGVFLDEYFIIKINENTYTLNLERPVKVLHVYSTLLKDYKESLSEKSINTYKKGIDKIFKLIDDIFNNLNEQKAELGFSEKELNNLLDILEKIDDTRKNRLYYYLLKLKEKLMNN